MTDETRTYQPAVTLTFARPRMIPRDTIVSLGVRKCDLWKDPQVIITCLKKNKYHYTAVIEYLGYTLVHFEQEVRIE